MEYEKNERNNDSVFSKKVRADRRRTYFIDVKATKSNDYFLTLTESRRKFNEEGFERHKIFIYKEDINKFVKGMNEAVEYLKTELMPDFDFDAFNHDDYEQNIPNGFIPNTDSTENNTTEDTEQIEKW